ncbi:hypothetical protein G3545_14110 [Starkeya sp. ORNL1]|uniref:hypothetical protein n=1 Tax=Starkeya sp. ORNL1 TaxID=2709380 RepID=UPI001463D23B|nr:hypothetical protein [Starkeya sp. ORNL1]QJP14678.1 hypothetical protein G3545_14110 [Starkeya sp. ORNL1]
MSKRETALEALKALLVAACPGADVKRNADVPNNVGPGGYLILRDGDPGEPEVTLSPPSYAYEHRAVLEILVEGGSDGTPETLLDTIFGDIDMAIATDPILGGAVDHCEPEAPDVDVLGSDAGSPLRTARLNIVLIYLTSSPLG